MRRRKFITLVCGAAVSPHRALAQRTGLPVIGILGSTSPRGYRPFLEAFREGLSAAGYVEGQNATIEYRWADGRYDRLPALAADLVRRQVAVIATMGGTPPTLAAMKATSTIPIVFGMSSDPVNLGLVRSLNSPGGNATGIAIYILELEAKKVQLMSELVPEAAVMALLVNPNNPVQPFQSRDASAAARVLGRELHILDAAGAQDFEMAFNTLAAHRAGALIVGADSVFLTLRDELVRLAARHAVPAIFSWREIVVGGGLISYGDSLTATYREMGAYTGRILKGANPAELPIRRPNRFELVINLRTAKSLGLTVPPLLLVRADEVIE
jgi:putative tryptophan/tyrosine transport system substrate-binding protein